MIKLKRFCPSPLRMYYRPKIWAYFAKGFFNFFLIIFNVSILYLKQGVDPQRCLKDFRIHVISMISQKMQFQEISSDFLIFI